MANVEVRLESVTWENIDDVVAHSESGDGFVPLPHDDDAAERYVRQGSNHRRHGKRDLLNAYTAQDIFVGGGQIYNTGEAIQFGYWVAWNKRRQGFGGAILKALEREACEILPGRENFELRVDARNQPSRILACSMGYVALRTKEDGMIVYRKQQLDVL